MLLGEKMFKSPLIRSLVVLGITSTFNATYANENLHDFIIKGQAVSANETRVVKLSPEQRHVYSAGAHLTVYDRQLGVIQDLGALGGIALDLIISPSGSFLYLVCIYC